MNNTEQTRQLLAEEMQNLRDKKTTVQNLNALTDAARQVLSAARLEIEYAKAQNREPIIPFISAASRELKIA